MSCDNCDWSTPLKHKPWQLAFWQTDCRLCLRIQGAVLASLFLLVVYGFI